MKKRNGFYEKGSLMHFAVIGFSNIKKLSESALISEKLLGLNALMFVLVISINLSFWLKDTTNIFSFEYLIIFLLSLLISLIISLVYSPFLSLIANFSSNKVDSLRLALTFIFISLPVSVAGLIYNIELLIKISIGIIAIQLVIVLFGSFIKYSKEPSQDIKVQSTDIWGVINKVSAICGVLSFIITIFLLIFN